MANGSINDADGYRFKTDWNGSTNYMRMTKGDISSKTRTNGLYLYTSDTIGKDRDLWIQYYNLYEGPLSRNVIGFTGMWRPQVSTHHPRLEMVVFSYTNTAGNVLEYKVNNNLHSYSSSNYYWEYGNTGSHSANDWHIAYAIDSARRTTIIQGGYMLYGMHLQIRFRTPTTGQNYANGHFWNFAPIIGTGSGGLTSINATNAKNEEGQIIYQRANRGKNPNNDEFLFAY